MNIGKIEVLDVDGNLLRDGFRNVLSAAVWCNLEGYAHPFLSHHRFHSRGVVTFASALPRPKETFVRRGMIVASEHVHDNVLPACAAKVRSWQHGIAPAWQGTTLHALASAGLRWESVFDAAHGRRYTLFAYAGREERGKCWNAMIEAAR